MANKFKLWVEDANINATQTYNDFDSDTQRTGGFVGGTPASAIRVNTALRQANLVACALMDVLLPDDNTIDFKSSRADLATAIEVGLQSITPEGADKVKDWGAQSTSYIKLAVVNSIPASPASDTLYLIKL